MLRYILLFVLTISLTSCSQEKGSKIKNMNSQTLKEEIKNNKELVVLDVRTPEELKGPLGQINGVINIPVDELGDRVDELEKYKTKKIAVICRSGARSRVATSILTSKGFNAYNVEGGMIDYNKQ